MVATRVSLPAADAEDEQPAKQQSKRVKNALKKLQIDGTEELKGRLAPEAKAVSPEEQNADDVEVYHFRGATYQVTPATRPEWLDKQPKRYQGKRGSSAMVEDEDMEDAQTARKQPLAGTKRKRSPEVEETPDRDGAQTEEQRDEDGPPSAKRARPHRTGAKYDKYYGRPKRMRSATSTPRRREGKAEEEYDRMRASRDFDFTVVGGRDVISCIEAERRRAASRGYQIEPLDAADLGCGAQSSQLGQGGHRPAVTPVLQQKQKRRRVEPASENVPECNVPVDEPTLQVTLKNSQSRQIIANGFFKVGKLNTKIDKLEADYQRVEAALAQLHQPRSTGTLEEDEIDDVIITSNSDPPPQSRPTNPPMIISRPPITSMQELTPSSTTPALLEDSDDSDESDVEIITERHDSGTDASYLPTLPSLNKAGAKLRWSLPAKLKEVNRAECAIDRSRLDGESKSARRRRVKRELKMVQSWAITDDGKGDVLQVAGAEEEAEAEVQTPLGNGAAGATLGSSPAEVGSSAERRNSSRLEKYRTKVCKFWRNGGCHRGSRCTYKHDKE